MMLVCLFLTAWLLVCPRSYGFASSVDTVRTERKSDENLHTITKTKTKPAVKETQRYLHDRQLVVSDSKGRVESEDDNADGDVGLEHMIRLSREAKDFDDVAMRLLQ